MDLRVELVAHNDPDGSPRWFAKLNGTEYPIEAYGVEPGQTGPLLSLLFAPSSIQIGEPSPGEKPADPASEKPRSVWGAPGRPDPREGIDGWTPEKLSGQVAANAEAVQA